jgi:hypothetical protein
LYLLLILVTPDEIMKDNDPLVEGDGEGQLAQHGCQPCLLEEGHYLFIISDDLYERYQLPYECIVAESLDLKYGFGSETGHKLFCDKHDFAISKDSESVS